MHKKNGVKIQACPIYAQVDGLLAYQRQKNVEKNKIINILIILINFYHL